MNTKGIFLKTWHICFELDFSLLLSCTFLFVINHSLNYLDYPYNNIIVILRCEKSQIVMVFQIILKDGYAKYYMHCVFTLVAL